MPLTQALLQQLQQSCSPNATAATELRCRYLKHGLESYPYAELQQSCNRAATELQQSCLSLTVITPSRKGVSVDSYPYTSLESHPYTEAVE